MHLIKSGTFNGLNAFACVAGKNEVRSFTTMFDMINFLEVTTNETDNSHAHDKTGDYDGKNGK